VEKIQILHAGNDPDIAGHCLLLYIIFNSYSANSIRIWAAYESYMSWTRVVYELNSSHISAAQYWSLDLIFCRIGLRRSNKL
jgi:hypothetical protein